MAIEVVMPQLGLSMDSGQIVEWLKRTGDPIQPGDLLMSVESDKSTVEVEAVERGRLHIVTQPEDGAVPVGSVIAYLLADGEAPPVAAPATPVAASPMAPSREAVPIAEDHSANGREGEYRPSRPPSSPAARRRAAELGLDWQQATGTGPAGRIKERDILAMAAQPAAPVAGALATVKMTPVAERLARSAGIDPIELARRFPGQRLGRDEIETVIRESVRRARQTAAPETADTIPARSEPAGRLRSLIAERMAVSHLTNAPVTLTTEADATELVRLRATLKNDPQADVVPSYNALLAKLVARALVEHPIMNAYLDGDRIVYWETVNIGTAVDTERGLVVPVVRDVPAKSVQEISREMAELLPRAKAGKALPDELIGGTFTITNLGTYDIDAFTPIINGAECAILGVGRLVDKYVVIDGQPQVRTMMVLSLTFDHRLVDGGPAAAFLQRVKQFIETPYLWLV
jgi:pyruvate dehydrogenase E2 component (dihydrolipoamide acetyltransferase)